MRDGQRLRKCAAFLYCIAVAIPCGPKAKSQPFSKAAAVAAGTNEQMRVIFPIRPASPDARRADGAAALEVQMPIRICRALRPDFRPG